MLKHARFENAAFLDLEWTSPRMALGKLPRPLRTPDPERVRLVADGLEMGGPCQRRVLDDTFEVLRSMGAPIDLSAAALTGSPSRRDVRLARAMERQLARLSTEGTSLYLGDEAALSSRQLQRIVTDFNRRYGLNGGNWRDTRNRWRLQIAAVLLSLPELRIESIAREVGFQSGASLARAFANAGFPAPAEVRERLLADTR